MSVLPTPVGDAAAVGVGESEGRRRRATLAVSGSVVLATNMLEADGKVHQVALGLVHQVASGPVH